MYSCASPRPQRRVKICANVPAGSIVCSGGHFYRTKQRVTFRGRARLDLGTLTWSWEVHPWPGRVQQLLRRWQGYARLVGRIALFVRGFWEEVRFRPGHSGWAAARDEFEDHRPAEHPHGASVGGQRSRALDRA